jgi:ABC-type Mn2+/Zn2+ transport system permease subunit
VAPSNKSLPTHATELWELVIAYVKQETVEPIKNLGRFVAFGIIGSVVLSLGLPLLVLAALRAAQTETDTALTGNLTWVPYLIAAGVSALFAALAVWGMARKNKRKKEAKA